MKSNIADTEHVFVSDPKRKKQYGSFRARTNDINYVKVLEQATLQPDVTGMGFTEDDDDEEMSSPDPVEAVLKNASNRRKQLRKSLLMTLLCLTISVQI